LACAVRARRWPDTSRGGRLQLSAWVLGGALQLSTPLRERIQRDAFSQIVGLMFDRFASQLHSQEADGLEEVLEETEIGSSGRRRVPVNPKKERLSDAESCLLSSVMALYPPSTITLCSLPPSFSALCSLFLPLSLITARFQSPSLLYPSFYFLPLSTLFQSLPIPLLPQALFLYLCFLLIEKSGF
jgi:hypothetical protein